MPHFHQILQQARNERRLTNAQISRMLGVSESYISKVMRGVRSPDFVLDELCQMLGIDPSVGRNGGAKKRRSA